VSTLDTLRELVRHANVAATARVVRAVESWLHAPTAGDRARALDAIDAEIAALRSKHAAVPAGAPTNDHGGAA
jgi:hypothetical protein